MTEAEEIALDAAIEAARTHVATLEALVALLDAAREALADYDAAVSALDAAREAARATAREVNASQSTSRAAAIAAHAVAFAKLDPARDAKDAAAARAVEAAFCVVRAEAARQRAGGGESQTATMTATAARDQAFSILKLALGSIDYGRDDATEAEIVALARQLSPGFDGDVEAAIYFLDDLAWREATDAHTAPEIITTETSKAAFWANQWSASRAYRRDGFARSLAADSYPAAAEAAAEAACHAAAAARALVERQRSPGGPVHELIRAFDETTRELKRADDAARAAAQAWQRAAELTTMLLNGRREPPGTAHSADSQGRDERRAPKAQGERA